MSLFATLERFRIRTHFTSVLLKLRYADTSDLSSTQKKNREKQIQVLEAYAKRGEYPKNTNHPGQRVPYFRDVYGTLCAVGYLMWQSGEHDLVESIVASDNYVRVMDISEGPALEWMEQNGLTQEECAEIQPTYGSYIACIDIKLILTYSLPILFLILENIRLYMILRLGKSFLRFKYLSSIAILGGLMTISYFPELYYPLVNFIRVRIFLYENSPKTIPYTEHEFFFHFHQYYTVLIDTCTYVWTHLIGQILIGILFLIIVILHFKIYRKNRVLIKA